MIFKLSQHNLNISFRENEKSKSKQKFIRFESNIWKLVIKMFAECLTTAYLGICFKGNVLVMISGETIESREFQSRYCTNSLIFQIVVYFLNFLKPNLTYIKLQKMQIFNNLQSYVINYLRGTAQEISCFTYIRLHSVECSFILHGTFQKELKSRRDCRYI